MSIKTFIKNTKYLFLPACLILTGCNHLTRTSEETRGINPQSELIQEAFIDSGSPGALISWRNADGKWQRLTLGTQVLGATPLSMDDTMALPIGSVSKLFVGYTLAHLIDQENLYWETPLSEVFPDWASEKWNPSVLQFAQHQSGLFNPIEAEAFQKQILEKPDRVWTDEALVTFALNQPTQGEDFGEFHYSNANSSMLVLMMEKTTGKSFEKLLEELRPEGASELANFRYHESTLAETIRGYRNGKPNWPIGYGDVLVDVTRFSPEWSGAAGNMVATLSDLESWAPALISGAGLSDANRKARHKTVATGMEDWEYGAHISYESGGWGHMGDVPGWSAAVLGSEDGQQIVIVLCNLSNTPQAMPPAALIAGKIFKRLHP